jgi:hypothetical protein
MSLKRSVKTLDKRLRKKAVLLTSDERAYFIQLLEKSRDLLK